MYLDVAELVLAEESSASEAHVAAAIAALSAIAASDAICGLALGRYHRGADHKGAVALLSTVASVDHTLPAKLRRVLSAKDSAHYSPTLTSRTDAETLLKQARSLVEAAERL